MTEEEYGALPTPTHVRSIRVRLLFVILVVMVTRTGGRTCFNFAISVGRCALSMSLHYIGDD